MNNVDFAFDMCYSFVGVIIMRTERKMIILKFPERLKALRIKKGLSQVSLADELDKSKQVICNYETGQRSPDLQTVIEIADYFGVSIDFLFGKTDYELPKTEAFIKETGISADLIEAVLEIKKRGQEDISCKVILNPCFAELIDQIYYYSKSDARKRQLEIKVSKMNDYDKARYHEFIEVIKNVDGSQYLLKIQHEVENIARHIKAFEDITQAINGGAKNGDNSKS
jgi:transcriptional regulator with XRE-family HTH domain